MKIKEVMAINKRTMELLDNVEKHEKESIKNILESISWFLNSDVTDDDNLDGFYEMCRTDLDYVLGEIETEEGITFNDLYKSWLGSYTQDEYDNVSTHINQKIVECYLCMIIEHILNI